MPICTCPDETYIQSTVEGVVICTKTTVIEGILCPEGCETIIREDGTAYCSCEDSVPPTILPVKKPVYFDNTSYFEDVSWTIAYKPTEGTWNSYFSWFPDYSVAHQNMFQTGYNWNESNGNLSSGTLWNHLMNNQSFGVFQGQLHKFAVEFPIANENVNKILNSISLNVEARRYQNEWDYSIHKNVSFSEGYIHNSTNNSGWFGLNAQRTLADNRKYPYLNGNKQEILFTADQNRQTFDYFFNRVVNQNNHIPLFNRDKNNIFKSINGDAVKFTGKRMLERLKGSEFLVYLQESKESRFNLILKHSTADETIIQD